MKKLLFALVVTLVSASICRADAWTEEYTRLLSKYVTAQGVKYAAWHDNAADRAALAKWSEQSPTKNPKAAEDEKLAFYLNAYNANILGRGAGKLSDQKRARHCAHFWLLHAEPYHRGG